MTLQMASRAGLLSGSIGPRARPPLAASGLNICCALNLLRAIGEGIIASAVPIGRVGVPATFDEVFALPDRVALGKSAFLLRGFARPWLNEILLALADISRHSGFRHMVTPRGDTMSVAMTNCGQLGWVTDQRGYRYTQMDPQTGAAWPSMPGCFLALAAEAATSAGFANFVPDACLINRYLPGAHLSLHQDKDEHDFGAPIVSVSLGMPATFLFGGLKRGDRPLRIPLAHADVVVWGGADRLRFHGVAPLKDSPHADLGAQRINLTFRKAG
jgi:alkylated DNA repair protein (DNA oxidative demethylase)